MGSASVASRGFRFWLSAVGVLSVSPNSPLSLKFRLDDTSDDPRDVEGRLEVETLAQALLGLVGDLGYRTKGPATVSGTVYRLKRDLFVDAQVEAEVDFGCVRCLEPRQLTVQVRVQRVLVPADRPKNASGDDGDEPATEDEKDALDQYEGDKIDLSSLMQEALILELPMNPTCADSQGSPCVNAEEVLSAGRTDEDTVDPRWAPLLALKAKLN